MQLLKASLPEEVVMGLLMGVATEQQPTSNLNESSATPPATPTLAERFNQHVTQLHLLSRTPHHAVCELHFKWQLHIVKGYWLMIGSANIS